MNIFGLSNFESTDRSSLSPFAVLALNTGGNLYDFVLGIKPTQERNRIREVLRREVMGSRACDCVMKIRLSPGVSLAEESLVF